MQNPIVHYTPADFEAIYKATQVLKEIKKSHGLVGLAFSLLGAGVTPGHLDKCAQELLNNPIVAEIYTQAIREA